MKKYNHLILGGTFDHFHIGHELFIKTALKKGKRLTIGITTEAMYERKLLSSQIESYKLRERNILLFIKKIKKVTDNVVCIPLTDVYGNGYTDKTVDGIVVTQDTKKGGELINQKRVELDMKPLDIIVVPMVKGDDGKVISSERIRYGDIDKIGKNYYKWLIDKAPFQLPISLRPRLREPLSDLIKGGFEERHEVVKKILTTIEKIKPPMVFAIGDIIAGSLKEVGYRSSIDVIDHRSRRQALGKFSIFNFQFSNVRKYRNSAGTITLSAIKQVKVLRDKWFKDQKPQQLIVQGEEDLVALPVILLAPIHSLVLYGQFDQGVVLVQVNEEMKSKVLGIMEQFLL